MKPETKKISKRWGSEKKVRLSSAPESSRPVPEPKEEDRFHKPAVPLITIGALPLRARKDLIRSSLKKKRFTRSPNILLNF